ncbi:MAG: hypothetical protein JW384_01619 [Nitrosomonadaceae bacterium]|nr:hypothetical protein [Nitrosomonadaceae bacterium]
MNAFINGEADAYAKRNPCGANVEPWFSGLVATIRARNIVEVGCGTGSRLFDIWGNAGGNEEDSIANEFTLLGVDAVSYNDNYSWAPQIKLLSGINAETWEIPPCDLAMFCYILHWLPSAEQVIERAMKSAKYILINDFYPPYAIDVPYAHCEGVTTRKRRYGMYCAEAGWVRHIAVKYRYHNEPDGETCCAEIWRKP